MDAMKMIAGGRLRWSRESVRELQSHIQDRPFMGGILQDFEIADAMSFSLDPDISPKPCSFSC